MPVTYDNVPDGGGDLFEGKKFFVHRQTPTSKTIIEHIKQNGGVMVFLEQNADIKIADHLKPDRAPQDAVSYRFIEKSVQSGRFQSLDNHRIGPPAIPSSSSGVTKGGKTGATRVRFTTADDILLFRWTAYWAGKNELHRGLSGNEIYKILEANYGRHTYQSWRDHWLRKLQYAPRPKISDPEPLRGIKEDDAKKEVAGQAQSVVVEEDPRVSPSPVSGTGSVRTRVSFTDEDDQILMTHVRRILNDNERKEKHLGGNVIYQELANDFPRHSANAWRDRYNKFLKHKHLENIAEGGQAAHVTSTQQQSNKTSSEPDGNTSNGDAERAETQQRLPRKRPLDIEEVDDNGVDEDDGDFWRTYQQFHQEQGVSNHRTQTPKTVSICGRNISLQSLWDAAQSLKVVPAERDWQQIAGELDFNWTTEHEEKAPEEALRAYDHLLSAFEEWYWGNAQGHRVPTRSPATGTPATKRQRANPQYPETPNKSPSKRRRLDRNHEIPSTPDYKTGTSHLREHDEDIDADEENAEESRQHVPSLPENPGARGRATEPETQDFGFDAETQRPQFETQVGDGFETQCSMTPSQQLLQESDTRSPHSEVELGTPIPGQSRPGQLPLSTIDEAASLVASSSAGGGDLARGQPNSKRRSHPESSGQRYSPSTPSMPRQNTLEGQIEHYMSLGYDRTHVIKALDAATWRPGTASMVMEELKSGNGLPANWRGVWTPQDDKALALVLSTSEPSDAKEERKRVKKRDRLVLKHTEDEMDLRRQYLEMRADRLGKLNYKI